MRVLFLVTLLPFLFGVNANISDEVLKCRWDIFANDISHIGDPGKSEQDVIEHFCQKVDRYQECVAAEEKEQSTVELMETICEYGFEAVYKNITCLQKAVATINSMCAPRRGNCENSFEWFECSQLTIQNLCGEALGFVMITLQPLHCQDGNGQVLSDTDNLQNDDESEMAKRLKSDESSTPNPKPTTTMKPPSTKKPTPHPKPTTTMKPPSTKKPTPHPKPTTTMKPPSTKKPTPHPKPTTTMKPPSTKKPTLHPKPTTTMKPPSTKKPTPHPKPTTTMKPPSTKKPTPHPKPTTTMKPPSTKKPTPHPKPTTTMKPPSTKKPTPHPKPTTTMKPPSTKKPTPHPKPTTTMKPPSTKKPTPHPKPTTTMKPPSTKKPTPHPKLHTTLRLSSTTNSGINNLPPNFSYVLPVVVAMYMMKHF